jgi:hypothetical protein
MMKGESGSIFWRFLIVVLSVAVVLAVVIPQVRQHREQQAIAACREQMVQIGNTQDEFRLAGGLYVDDLDSLKAYVPAGIDLGCPIDGRSYLISAVDSSSYTISCPNEHGLVNMGKKSWEKK